MERVNHHLPGYQEKGILSPCSMPPGGGLSLRDLRTSAALQPGPRPPLQAPPHFEAQSLRPRSLHPAQAKGSGQQERLAGLGDMASPLKWGSVLQIPPFLCLCPSRDPALDC